MLDTSPNKPDHKRKVAVVTGGSRGIGRAIALRLAQGGAGREGAHVIVNFRHGEDAAREVVRLIEEGGGSAEALGGDWADDASREAFFGAVASTWGHVDWLVNNAGAAAFAPLEQVTPESFDSMFGLNVRGLFFGTQRAAGMMREGGRIVSISSGITRVNASGASVYAASKAAVEMFTKSWAAELGPHGITVNAVSPGMTHTDLLREVASDEVLESMKAQTPLGRLGQPEDIADVVAFLCSDEARWLTAQNLLANGGVG
jgi:3-oxoacyl-[acyl-carrier protein] reductase